MAVAKFIAKNGKVKWRYKVWYTDWKGERKQEKHEFNTQREAKEAEIDFLNKHKRDVTITFANLVEAYRENRAARIEQTTLATKDHMIRTKILPYFANIPISNIDTAMVMNWQTELMNYRNPKTNKPYSQTYLRQIHNQLSTIFNFAIRYYGLSRNPAQLCGSMGKQNAEKFDFWTYDEFQWFIQAAKDDINAYTTFNLFFYSGMRMGELLALTLNDFDFDKCTVSINKSLAVIDGEQTTKKTKTEKSKRIVALPVPIMEMIKEYAGHLYEYNPANRLFISSKTSLHRDMRKYCEISGVRKIKVHELRHSHASHLIELGVSPLSISERLGHEDIKTTVDIKNPYEQLKKSKQLDCMYWKPIYDLCHRSAYFIEKTLNPTEMLLKNSR